MTLQVIPIVVLTASQKERDHIAALDSGADRFLSKDSPPEELLAVVTGLLKSAIAVESVDRDLETRNSFLSGARLLAIDDSRGYQRLPSHDRDLRPGWLGTVGTGIVSHPGY
jgi:DNA-binding response OmpR family regulator